jgi:hypothetical protein
MKTSKNLKPTKAVEYPPKPKPAGVPKKLHRPRKPVVSNPNRARKRKPRNIDDIIHWVATSGTPREPGCLGQFVHVGQALARLGARGDASAMKALPEYKTKHGNFNGVDLALYLDNADKLELGNLQRIFAAMRLRVRHAKWLQKKGL